MSNEQKGPQPNRSKRQPSGYWMTIGLALGAGIGLALDNLPIGVAIGMAVGVAIDAAQRHKNK
ncbi:MAG: hypothetical protein EHM33_09580 [Chloroflexi bacterium]|nr:MAG: hypothetical protein EHM33_09580 [Chloroflexota bacterium]